MYCEKLLSLLRLRAIQISISHDQLNNRNSNNDDDLLATTNMAATGSAVSGNTLAPMMPIVQQPRRPLGRESFRQRNIGCVPQNMVFRQDQPNLNIDNCFVLKSQLRRYVIVSSFNFSFCILCAII